MGISLKPAGRSLSRMIVEARESAEGVFATVGCGLRVGFLVGLRVIVGLKVMVGVREGTSVAVGVHVGGKTSVIEMLVMVVVGCGVIFSGVCVGVAVQAAANRQLSMKKQHFDFMISTLYDV
jgi:hypothetical protein